MGCVVVVWVWRLAGVWWACCGVGTLLGFGTTTNDAVPGGLSVWLGSLGGVLVVCPAAGGLSRECGGSGGGGLVLIVTV